MVLSVYNYDIEMSFISSDNSESRIVPQSIQYIIIDNDYKSCIMPTICIRIKLDASIYNKMVADLGKGKVGLNIMKYNTSGTSNVKISYIQDQFDYIMSDDLSNTSGMDKLVEGQGVAFKTCTIGLVKKELTENLQRQFNGVYTNTTMSSLVLDATSNFKLVMEPFKYNTTIENLVVPPIDSVSKYISYLNNKYNFYGDQYLFYLDFDKAYLKSQSGRYIDAKDGHHKYIAIDIQDLTKYQSHTTGMVIDKEQDAYIIYVDKHDADYNTDRISTQIAANIVSIDETGVVGTSTVDTSAIINTIPDNDSTVYVKNSDPNITEYMANIISNNSVTIQITKTDMDNSVFTPNKQYLISNYEGNNAFTGRYFLVGKKEVFLNRGQYFTSGITLLLKMVLHY